MILGSKVVTQNFLTFFVWVG